MHGIYSEVKDNDDDDDEINADKNSDKSASFIARLKADDEPKR